MKSRVSHPMIILLLLLFLSGPTRVSAQEQVQYKALNWGFRLGLNASNTVDFETFYDGQLTENESLTGKVGLNAVVFTRINLDDFILQPELSWNTCRQQMSFYTSPADTPEALKETLNLSRYSGNLSVLAGYNIIHNGPYIFSVMAGASFRYNYKSKFDFQSQGDFSTNQPDYNYLGILAVSAIIDKVYFDFRYELNLPNSDISFNKLSEASENLNPISIRKKENIISFSCGLLF